MRTVIRQLQRLQIILQSFLRQAAVKSLLPVVRVDVQILVVSNQEVDSISVRELRLLSFVLI